MITNIRAHRCEKIPEELFNEEDLDEEWSVVNRGNGFVYIAFRHQAAEETPDEKKASV